MFLAVGNLPWRVGGEGARAERPGDPAEGPLTCGGSGDKAGAFRESQPTWELEVLAGLGLYSVAWTP